jgi:uncharacterized protein (DUF924 family)
MAADAPLPPRAAAMIDFWFGPPGDPGREQRRGIWFNGPAEFDEAVRAGFLADHEAAAAGACSAWEETPLGALALLLLLDQVPRNAFRGTPAAYRSDALAREVAGRALARGFDRRVPPVWRMFFYLPLFHSEDIADQRRALELSAAMPRDPDRPEGRGEGRRHHDVIARFGRFPHRNAILGRPSTPEELAYLAEPEAAHWRRYYRREGAEREGEP